MSKIDTENIKLIIDTREKDFFHIKSYFEGKGIECIRQGLKFGDYSFIYFGEDYSNRFAIERKNSLEEISANITSSRERFKRELLRAKDSFFVILIENGSYNQIINNEYSTKVHPKSFLTSLLSLQLEYNCRIDFASKKYAPIMLYNWIYYYLRNEDKKSLNKENVI